MLLACTYSNAILICSYGLAASPDCLVPNSNTMIVYVMQSLHPLLVIEHVLRCLLILTA